MRIALFMLTVCLALPTATVHAQDRALAETSYGYTNLVTGRPIHVPRHGACRELIRFGWAEAPAQRARMLEGTRLDALTRCLGPVVETGIYQVITLSHGESRLVIRLEVERGRIQQAMVHVERFRSGEVITGCW
ncbi:MAG: hypothetical protein AB7S26_01440 [Sandaracinaceae bacterium]